MPDIRIHRDHQLGLAQARRVAWQWAEEVEKQFDMVCTVVEGETRDTVEFSRSGVSGELVVAGDFFDLHARLGFLLGAFKHTIETEILKNLDELLAKAQGNRPSRASATRKAAASPAAAPATAGKPVRKPPRQ